MRYFSAKRGSPIDIQSLLPSDRTISNRIKMQGDHFIKELGCKLVRILETDGGCIGIDYGKKLAEYLGINLYFIDDDW